jgi:hypothetical protein
MSELAKAIEQMGREQARYEAALRGALVRIVAWRGAVEITTPELGGLIKAIREAEALLGDGKDRSETTDSTGGNHG